MTPDETTVATRPEVEETTAEVETTVEAIEDVEEDFNPLGKIEGWSAYECANGPFGNRG